MAAPLMAATAEAAATSAGRYGAQAWQAFKAQSSTAGKEAALGIRESAPGVKVNRAPRQLTSNVGKTAGRNSQGRITIFHRGGGSKRLHRKIDLKRSTACMGVIERIEYDPNRSSRIALVRWEDTHPRFHKKVNVVDELVPPCKIVESTTATTRGVFSLSSLSREVSQRKITSSPPSLTGTYAMVGPQTGNVPGLRSLPVGNCAESQKTCARDVFLSAFSTPSANRKTASLPLSGSLNIPRITVAGAKPVYFAAQMREKDGEKNTFCLTEIQKWNSKSIVWAHRMKRKAAVLWRSFRWQDTLGFAEAADSNESKPESLPES